VLSQAVARTPLFQIWVAQQATCRLRYPLPLLRFLPLPQPLPRLLFLHLWTRNVVVAHLKRRWLLPAGAVRSLKVVTVARMRLVLTPMAPGKLVQLTALAVVYRRLTLPHHHMGLSATGLTLWGSPTLGRATLVRPLLLRPLLSLTGPVCCPCWSRRPLRYSVHLTPVGNVAAARV
jgi:hypothetical protein